MQTGVRHAVETVVGVYSVSVAPSEVTTDLLCLDIEAVAALLCVVLVAELVVCCLTSGTKSLVKAELLPETMDGLL